jgi:signal transduction histidine kinase
MAARRERLVPALVVAGSVVLAVVVVLLLQSAASRGRSALEASLVAEVQAVARSQDQRLASTLQATQGLAANTFELTEGSDADLEYLQSLLALVPNIRTGFFLTNSDGVITQGVQLLDDGSIGERYGRPGFDDLVGSPTFAQGVGGILDVGDGITTTSPTVAIVLPLLDRTSGALRGSFVFESEVAGDSDFNSEIRQLSRGQTGRYVFFDDQGTIIAANDDSLIATTLADDVLLTGEPGLYRLHGDIAVVAPVPSAGWRVAFEQDEEEFESGLAGPIQTVGTVVVLVLLAVGAGAGLLLLRRLRAAREEQERLQRLAAAQEEFVSIVSHELRTPVAGVLGFLQTTIDHWESLDDAERLGTVRRAATNARRLQSLTRDVLDSESLEAGRMTFSFGTVDLAEEARAAVATAAALYDDRTIEVDAPPTPLLVQGDADRLHQVLGNLIDNAVQNAPPSEPVRVSVRADGGAVELRVSDQGPGLPEDVAARVFDKFVRGRADRVGGTGLGLYIARNIVEAHNGTIAVDSEPASGATFIVRLPATRATQA